MNEHSEGNRALQAPDRPDPRSRDSNGAPGTATDDGGGGGDPQRPEAFARVKPPPPEQPQKPPVYKRPLFWVILVIVAIGGATGGILYWLNTRDWESTDDAFIQADVTQVSPRVADHVMAVHVRDNQEVKVGDVLVDLDPADFQVKVDEAQAAVVTAQMQIVEAQSTIVSAQADLGQAEAAERAAQAEADRASDELKRYESLNPEARIQQQLINYQAAVRTADANLQAAKQKTSASRARVQSAEAQVKVAQAQLKQSQVSLTQAQLNLSYTKIVSPIVGHVTNRSVNDGDYVQVGQALMALVPPDPEVTGPNYRPGVFVIANYKETQLDRMQPGQPVEFTVDAYPGHTFHGQVDSIQRGSGAAFSLLPPENATGNYVKVVQRVPVKITFNSTDGLRLGPGMSVVPRVKVR